MLSFEGNVIVDYDAECGTTRYVPYIDPKPKWFHNEKWEKRV